MKVLQINSVCGYGSTGRIAADLSRYLTQSGDDCLIAYGRGHAPDDVKSIRIGTDFDVNLHGVCSRITDKHGFYSKRATQRFIQQAREYHPDIIHLHNLHGYYLHLPTLFEWLRECGKPVVWTLHDCWAFTGHCSHFDFVGCDRWKTSCHDCPQKREYPASYVFDRSDWNYEQKKKMFSSLHNLTIITPSYWLKNLVQDSFLGKYRVDAIHNGIDLSVFHPIESDFRKQHGLHNKFVAMGAAGTWTQRKGLQYLLELADCLEDNYKVIIAGLSKKQIDELPPHILGIPKTQNALQLAQIYSAADVFLNPTLEDTFPTTNMEAIACATPVITFNTGGCKECITKDTGIVIEKTNTADLVMWVRYLCANPDFFSDKKLLAKAQDFDDALCNESYLRLYQSAVRR